MQRFARAALAATPLVLLAGSCSGPPRREPRGGPARREAVPARADGAAGAASQPASRPAAAERRRLRVWGSIRLILKDRHAKLPALARSATDATDPPRTAVINDTPYDLRAIFAGPCAEQIDVPPLRGSTCTGHAVKMSYDAVVGGRTVRRSGCGRIITFCPGKYHIAAVVRAPSFLPAARKDEPFERGFKYVLAIHVKAKPRTIRTRRWIEEKAPSK